MRWVIAIVLSNGRRIAIGEIEIFDIAGRRVAMLRAENGQAVWDAKGLSSGVYFARAAGGEGMSNTIKLILMK